MWHQLGQSDINLASVEKNLAGVKKNLAGVEKNLAGVEKNLARVEKNLASVEKNLASIIINLAVHRKNFCIVFFFHWNHRIDITNLFKNPVKKSGRMNRLTANWAKDHISLFVSMMSQAWVSGMSIDDYR